MNKRFVFAITAVCMVIAFAFMGCDLLVNEPIRDVPIFHPYISIQPQSYSFVVGAANYETPELKVEIWDWDKYDGILSYQWYTFDTLENYMKGNAVPVDGATSAAFTPSITPAAGKVFYYYAEITNTNKDAIGIDEETEERITTSTIKSDVAMISFVASGSPVHPAITQSPLSSSYIIGRTSTIASLEVRAAVPNANGFALRYQWYRFTLNAGFNTDGTPKGTLIAGATERSYLPSSEELPRGDNYFYAVISHVGTNPEGAVTAQTDQFCIPAIIKMAPGQRAAAPRIDVEPKDILYFEGEDKTTRGVKLSVESVSLDGGQLSWQWYSKANAAATALPITNAIAKEFEPAIDTASAGSILYYVVVTNKNEEVLEETTATATSRMVSVRVIGTGSTEASNATLTFNTDETYQYIRGYGGMETTWGNFYQSTEGDMENMFNPDILGYNIWRIMIPPVSTDIKEGIDEILSRYYADRYYKNPAIVNKYNGYVLASPWSMPKEWKSNNSINSGGHLIYSYRKQYANYLRAFARLMANNDAPIYAVSIQNEPNYAGGYDGCEWTPIEMRDFFKEVGRFTQGVRGWGGGRQIPTVLTVMGESANNPDINYAAMNDPVSNAAIDLFARHVYGNQTSRLWGHQNLNNREVWMTEHNINSASEPAYPNDYTWNYLWRFMNDVDLVIRLNNENAFVWWVVKRFYSFISDGAAGLTGGQNITGVILPRGWGLAHYSKFTIDKTRIGFNLTGTLADGTTAIALDGDIAANHVTGSNVNWARFDLDNTSARITAFQSQDGNELSLVMFTPTMTDGSGGFDLGTIKIEMPAGFKIRDAKAMTSNHNGSPASGGDVSRMGIFDDTAVRVGPGRDTAFVTLPRSRIISVKFIKE